MFDPIASRRRVNPPSLRASGLPPSPGGGAGKVRSCLTLGCTSIIAALTACQTGDVRSGVEGVPIEIQAGELAVQFRDNSSSPQLLSGVDRLVHLANAPDFDAFDPHDPGSSAGLNFEHIIAGHADPANWFAPRHGPYALRRGNASNSVILVRQAKDDPWALASTMEYTVTAPHAIDFEFRCRPHDVRRFGRHGYAVLFWANYLNDVEDVALHFRGVTGPGGPEQWVAADAPAGPPDYVGGGTYRHAAAAPLAYDTDHNLKLNLWSYEYPRFTVPCYYGLAAHGMVFILMFDRAWSVEDEIRFSLFKFKVGEQVRRPAWDFQYVIHRVEAGKEYGYRGRLVWKRFVSPEDCLQEYQTWVRSLAGTRAPGVAAPEPSPALTKAEDPNANTQVTQPGWRLPPRGPVARRTPGLVNYFHLDLPEGRVDHKEERLAQWNVVILNHDLVAGEGLSLTRMRTANPDLTLLAWIPLQGAQCGLGPRRAAPGGAGLVRPGGGRDLSDAALGRAPDERVGSGPRLAATRAELRPPALSPAGGL
ncbi:MAG: hypothetical protein M5U12_15445 [Verrucomicrobia bacterium]|nr:hypothetical protein [Verrucomicrobiota bacterium]